MPRRLAAAAARRSVECVGGLVRGWVDRQSCRKILKKEIALHKTLPRPQHGPENCISDPEVRELMQRAVLTDGAFSLLRPIEAPIAPRAAL